MRSRTLVPLLAVPLALAAGCGSVSASPGSGTSPSASPSATAKAVAGSVGGSVSGKYGTEPKVVVPHSPAPAVVTYRDIRVGTGATATPTSNVTVNYEGVDYATGKVFDASWTDNGPASFSLDGGTIPGFALGIAGMRTGGEREIVVPSAYGYGAKGQSPAITPNENLIFVVELIHVSSGATPTVKAVRGKIGGSVTGPLGQEPHVITPQTTPPKVVTYRDIIVGKGAPADASSDVTVQYVGLNYATGQIFDASWSDGHGAATFTLSGGLLPGLQAGISGMRVGGRREIVIPPKYGDANKGNGAIKPNETLVFVVDLLKIKAAS